MELKIGNNTLEVELYDTPTAKKIENSLPIEGNAITWGKEIYFSIPVDCVLEADAKEIVEIGELAFYPPMNAFCIFFGPTPVSTDERPKAADLVNVFGKIKGDLSILHDVRNGDLIIVSS